MFTLKSNIDKVNRRIDNHLKQVRYATSRAINETTRQARQEVINHVRGVQKSKRQWWNHRVEGILREFASKKRLIGAVFTKVYWSKLQEEGGTKRPRGKAVSVPTSNVPKSRRKAGGAKAMAKGKKVFMAKDAMWRRIGGKKSRRIQRLFTFVPSAEITKPILSLREICHRVVKKTFKKNLDQALRDAWKTAKR